MQNAKPCSMCGHADHVEWRCPELVAPIRQEGIMKPPPGQPMGGDEEDSTSNFILNTTIWAKIIELL